MIVVFIAYVVHMERMLTLQITMVEARPRTIKDEMGLVPCFVEHFRGKGSRTSVDALEVP